MSDLLNPNSGPSVAPLARFRTRDEQGNVIQSHPAIPVRKAETKKYYVCTIKSASLHNFDGKKIPFVDGFLVTDLVADQNYLDNEIAEGNPYILPADENQVLLAKMKLDPSGTIEERLRPKLEAEIRAELEVRIRAEMDAKNKNAVKIDPTKTAPAPGQIDGDKLAGTGGNKLAELAKLRSEPATGSGATITPVSTSDIKTAAKG